MQSISRRRFLKAGAAALAVQPLAGFAQSSDWPTKLVRIIVGYPAGGLTDTLARVFGEVIGEKTGQRFIVDNRPGASNIIGTDIVAKATPDGYTILWVSSTHAINAGVRKALEDPAVHKRIEETGSLVIANTPEQFAVMYRNGFDLYARAYAKAGIKPE